MWRKLEITHGAGRFRFPHAKEFLRKLFAIWAGALSTDLRGKIEGMSVLSGVKLLARRERSHVGVRPSPLTTTIKILHFPPHRVFTGFVFFSKERVVFH